MKNYKAGIIIGIISIISNLTLVGIPFGSNLIEIINEIIFAIGLLMIQYFGIIKKNDKSAIISMILYIILLLIFTTIVELNYKKFYLLAIGFLPGLIISIIGLIRTKNNKEKYKTKVSLVLNTLGLITSIISIIMIFLNGGFIINK